MKAAGERPRSAWKRSVSLHLQAGRALAHHDVELVHRRIRHLASAEIGDVHALLDPFGVVDRLHAVGAAGQNVGAAHGLAGARDGAHLDIEPTRHLIGERFAVLGIRAVDLARSNIADALERFEEGARHAAGTEHADNMGIFAREIFGADAGATADPHVLQHAVVDEGQRLAIAR